MNNVFFATMNYAAVINADKQCIAFVILRAKLFIYFPKTMIDLKIYSIEFPTKYLFNVYYFILKNQHVITCSNIRAKTSALYERAHVSPEKR